MMFKKYSLFASTLVLLLISLACNLPGISRASEAGVEVSTQAVGELQQNVQQAVQQAAQSGTLTLEITESQVTSAIALAMQKQADVPVKDVQVRLRDGQIQIEGTASQKGMEFPAKVAVSISVSNCKPKLAVESASIGPFPLPQEQLSSFLPMAEQALDDLITSSSLSNICLLSISVGDGKMTINGSVPK